VNEVKSKFMGVLILAVVALNLILGANAWKSSLKLKQITVEGNRLVATNEIIQLTQTQPGALLYNIDLTAVQRNVSSHYYIKDAVAERNLPSTLSITVTERVPLAMINRPDPLFIDEDGVILPNAYAGRAFDLPLISGITGSDQLTAGTVASQPETVEALQLLSVLKVVNRPLFHNISEIVLRGGGDIVLYSAEGGVPIIFGRGEISAKIARLEAFWNTVVRTRGTQDLQYVDLRFEDQIIARWNPVPHAGGGS